jgi:serine/threonine protein kinase
MSDQIGQKVRGYEIREKLGEGSYGVVYKAYQPSIDREVAIKVILPSIASEPEFIQRFENEARLVARLEHPHIVPLYDFWQDESGVYLAMRCLRGGSLRAVLKRQEALSLAQTMHLLTQICDALSAAHQMGVIHRDLKPDNIILDERGNFYLTDFGIAKNLQISQTATASGAIVGTPAYASPEQIQGLDVTPQSDVYSLGIMLYEMLVGERPFIDANIMQLIMKHIQEPVPSLLKRRPDLPEAVDQVIQKATRKNPEERYANTLHLAEAFRTAANLLPGSDVSTPLDLQISSKTAAVIVRKLPTPKIPNTPEARNRYYMLQNVRAFWIEGVLENSLHGAALLELGMQQPSGQVENPWDVLLRRYEAEEETLPPGTTTLEIFDKLSGTMLILGAPGSGKTTTMLELARALIERAETDMEHPLPVVFNLSSWSENSKPIPKWLVDELVSKYQAPRKVAEDWVEGDMLLPLLDGLDEVVLNRREACVRAINDYRDERGFVDMVVCSRIADYELLDNKLKLNGAILLKPLTDAQIDLYLARLGEPLEPLRKALKGDEVLRELARSPLMLSIMSLAYRGLETRELSLEESAESRRERLFEIYVRRVFERRLGSSPYTPHETTRYLSWLAGQMVQHAQSVFHIEHLQPDWLTPEQRQRYYQVIRLIHIPASGLIYGLPCLLIPPASQIPNWFAAIMIGLTGVVIGWLYTGGWWKRNIGHVIAGLAYALAYGACMYVGYGTRAGWAIGILSFIAFGISSKLVMARFLEDFGSDIDRIVVLERLHFTVKEVRPAIGVVGFIIGGAVIVIFGLVAGNHPTLDISQFALPVLIGGLAQGALFLFITGLDSDEIKIRTRPNQGIYSSLRNANIIMSAVILVFFIVGVLGVSLVSSPALGITMWLAFVGSVGYAFWFISGGFSVIQHLALRLVLERDKLIPRQFARFLDYATGLILLRKVGGGYIFIHRYLLEYFAGLKDNATD